MLRDAQRASDHLAPVRTPLAYNPFYSKQLGCNVYVKDESKQRTGTIKDRRSYEFVCSARKLGYPAVATITNGNAGYSLGRYAKLFGLSAFSIISQDLDPRITERLARVSQVIRIDLDRAELSEYDLWRLIIEETGSTSLIDRGVQTFDLYQPFFAELASQIAEWRSLKLPQARHVKYIIFPVGSGELLISASHSMDPLGLTKTKLIGVTIPGNPFAQFSSANPGSFSPKEKSIADKLYAPYVPLSVLGPIFANPVFSPGAEIRVVTEQQISDAYQFLRPGLDFSVEPSSAAAFAALGALMGSVRRTDVVIVINTGRGLYFD